MLSPTSKRWMLFFMSQKGFEELVPSNLSTSETNTRYAYFHQTMCMHATSLGALLWKLPPPTRPSLPLQILKPPFAKGNSRWIQGRCSWHLNLANEALYISGFSNRIIDTTYRWDSTRLVLELTCRSSTSTNECRRKWCNKQTWDHESKEVCSSDKLRILNTAAWGQALNLNYHVLYDAIRIPWSSHTTDALLRHCRPLFYLYFDLWPLAHHCTPTHWIGHYSSKVALAYPGRGGSKFVASCQDLAALRRFDETATSTNMKPLHL